MGDLREIRVAAVQLWSSTEHSPDQNRKHALEMLKRAAAGHPDLVVLPEAVSMLCYPDGRPDFSYRDVADPIPGEVTEAISRIAANYRINVVVGLIEDRGAERPCQNMVMVFDRQGRVAGRYEKTHEPDVCRYHQAAAVGDALPVFELDFGRIGIFVCWDILAPEVPAILSMKGAELLCFPHLIALPAPRPFAPVLRARAIDNAVPIAAAGMRDAHNHAGGEEGLYPTCIIDHRGQLLTQVEEASAGVASALLQLGAPDREDWSVRRLGELRPDLYAREYAALSERMLYNMSEDEREST